MPDNSGPEAGAHDKARKADPAPPQSHGGEGLFVPQLPMAPLSMFGDPRLNGRGNQPVKNAVMQRMQTTYGNRATQRFLQRMQTGSSIADATNDIGTRIQVKAGSGSTLDAPTRERLESGLGADMSGVRVHTDSEADSMARSVNSVAFTTGSDIFFKSGTYNPASPDGLRLLAHEATHTVQQAAGPVSGTPTDGGVSVSDPSDSFEQAAEHAAEQVASGGTTAHAGGTASGTAQRKIDKPGDTIQRKADTSIAVQRDGGTAPAAAPPGAQTPGAPGIGGKHTFTTPKLNVPSGASLGPIEYDGADAYAEINYEVFQPGQDAGAAPTSGSSTQVRAGVTQTKDTAGYQAEVQHQWDAIAKDKLGGFQPTLKGAGNVTPKGGELGVEGGLEGKKFSTSLKFTIVGVDLEKGKIEFATLTWGIEVPVFKPDPLTLSSGVKISSDIKAKFDFKFKPNYKELVKYVADAIAEAGLETAALVGIDLAIATGPMIALAISLQVGEAKNQMISDARLGARDVKGAAFTYGNVMIGSDGGGDSPAAAKARAKGKQDFKAMAEKSGLGEEPFKHAMQADTKGMFHDYHRFAKEALQTADFPYRKKVGDNINAWKSEHYILAAFTDMSYFQKQADDVITEEFNKL